MYLVESKLHFMAYWVSTILLILGIYIAVSIALYYLQDYMLFKPEKLPKDFQFDYENQQTKEYNLETRDGAMINGLRFFQKGKVKVWFYILKVILRASKVGENLL